MTIRRRQPRMQPGSRRHVQIYLDQALHDRIRQLAQEQCWSFSMAARELMEIGAASLNPISTDTSHGN
jgi:hypothetical protein